ncbi:MAG: transcription initiation factor IIB [Candidatus Micrarchaeota archaeon]|nr:MAG: transcription initiation factor IIB [Candidatus Micrarchaeota archaeon]
MSEDRKPLDEFSESPKKKVVVDKNEKKIALEDEEPEVKSEEESRKPIANKCPSCGSTDITYDIERGEYVCNNCGMIIDQSNIDAGPEWRAFDSDQKATRTRTGAPMKLSKSNRGLVTEIDAYNKDVRGVRISSKKQAQLYRMRKWNKRANITNSSERNYLIALPELNRVASYLGLPDSIRESAALLYRKCVKNNLIRGRPIEVVVQAVIYAACRQAGIPRTLDEIAQLSGVQKKEVGRTYRVIAHALGLHIPLTDPMSYVPRYAAALKLSPEAKEKAVEILNEAMKKGLVSGRSPTGVSAAAVYIAGALVGERRTQKEVAKVAGVTEVTIRNRYRELKEQLGLDVNL